jgi:hypothetical protein
MTEQEWAGWQGLLVSLRSLQAHGHEIPRTEIRSDVLLAADHILIAARAYVAALEASDDRPIYGTGSALDKAADELVAAVGEVSSDATG